MATRKKEPAVTDSKNENTPPAQNVEEKNTVQTQTPTTTPPAAPNHDETDVKSALARNTQDGKGPNEVPPANFVSFATDKVEGEADPKELAREALNGKWGYSRRAVLRNLREQGHDSDAVDDELQKLIDSGAPSTLVN